MRSFSSSAGAMGRQQRVSNGECPLYGRVRSNPQQELGHWRNRICNEQIGSASTDATGERRSAAPPKAEPPHPALLSFPPVAAS